MEVSFKQRDASEDSTRNTSVMMRRLIFPVIVIILGVLAVLGGRPISVQVPNGLAFSEFRGYEGWPVIAISENGGMIAVIVGNPVTIDAYKKSVPGNGEPFSDGAKIAKIDWIPKKPETYPGRPTVPSTLHDVDFMLKDSKRFADGGGWGWGAFDYDEALAAHAGTNVFSPSTVASNPPQGNDAKCGFACHTVVKNRDYVFTEVSSVLTCPGDP